MTDNTELKRLAEAANAVTGDVSVDIAITSERGPNQSEIDAVTAFVGAATPTAVLALIAENDHLAMCAQQWEQAAMQWAAERDQLLAEVAGLRTGYEAYEQVNAEMKAECARSTEREILQLAEIEALRKALESCADELSAEVICKHGGQKLEDMHPVTRRLYDRDMASVIDARAALGQGEQS